VGNLIESGGKAVGDGLIANSIVGVGEGINKYGTSVRNATAPNAGGYTATKKVEAKSTAGSKVGEKKALPASSERKALPSTKPMKALPAPPAKKDALPKPKSTYTPYQAPAAVKKQEPNKARTLASGKVVPQSSALPKDSPIRAKTFQTPAAGKSPYPPKAPSLNLPAAKAPSLNLPSAKAPSLNLPATKSPKPPASKAGSVVGGPQKNLAIPGFGLPGAKAGGSAPSRAPTVVNGGNKTVAKPPPSKAGSVAGSYAKGGPSFF